MATRKHHTSKSGGMPAGYIATIVIASVAIVAALLIGIMYAVNDKSKKCTVKRKFVPDAHNPSVLIEKNKEPVKVRDLLPVLNVAKPAFNQAVAKRVQAKAPVLAQTAAPAAVHPVHPVHPVRPVPAVPAAPAPAAMNPSEISAGGASQADRIAKHSAAYASKKHNASVEAAMQPAGPGNLDTVKASFVASGLQSLVQGGKEGTTMQHTPSRTIKSAGNIHTDFHDSDFSVFDPEGSEKLDKAMALTGTPQRFHESEEAEAINRKAALLNNLAIGGKVDASIEEVLSLTAPMVATKSALLRAVQSASNLERDIVLPPPMRFLYDTKLIGSRMASIIQTPTPMEFNNSAGVDHMVSQNTCDGRKNYEAW